MKNSLKSLPLLAIALFLLSSCNDLEVVIASSAQSTQEHAIDNYQGINVASAIKANVVYSGSEERIIIDANENLHQYIEVERINNNLSVKLRNGIRVRGNHSIKATIITSNPLDQFIASGASIITLDDKLVVDEVTIDLSGASRFLGTVEAGITSVHLSGASQVDIAGTTEELSLSATGASQFRNYDFIVDASRLVLSGASSSYLTINGDFDVVASGASVVRYKGIGNAQSTELSGASQLIKVN